MYDMIMCMCVLFLNNGQIKTNSSSSSSSSMASNRHYKDTMKIVDGQIGNNDNLAKLLF